MIEYLPKDLWVQIFLRLPVKTLLRCLAVCKSWQVFIQHPTFINAHLQYQRSDLMFVRYVPGDDEHNEVDECYSIHCDDESFNIHAKHDFPNLCRTNGHYRVVGSCNGIICITNDRPSIRPETYLWNPTIRKFIELPRPEFTFDKVGGFEHELGFGFDENTDDYKVVRIVDKVDWNDAPLEVEIYSLKSGIWSKASHLALDLRVQILGSSFSAKNCHVYLNGAVHWLVWKTKVARSTIIVFHLGDEAFRCFEPPAGIIHDPYWLGMLRPVVFQGSLSLIHYLEQKCSIWVMKDYGVCSSWIKHLDINLSDQVNRVIGLRNTGEILIEILGDLYSYDPEAVKGRKFNFLDGWDLLIWKSLQDDPTERQYRVREYICDYDPEAAPKYIGISRNTRYFTWFSFCIGRYTESLALLGRMNSAKVGKVENKEEESETSHEKGKRTAGSN